MLPPIAAIRKGSWAAAQDVFLRCQSSHRGGRMVVLRGPSGVGWKDQEGRHKQLE